MVVNMSVHFKLLSANSALKEDFVDQLKANTNLSVQSILFLALMNVKSKKFLVKTWMNMKKTCLSAIVHCEYGPMGCECAVARRDLVKHNEENVHKHLSLTKGLLNKTKIDCDVASQNLEMQEKQHADFVLKTNLAISTFENIVQQIAFSNTMAEKRISELERELQSLK